MTTDKLSPTAKKWYDAQERKPDILESRVWEVRGPDTNFDLSGSHVEPLIGHWSGVFWHVLEEVASRKDFASGADGYPSTTIKALRVSIAQSPEKKLADKREQLKQKLTALTAELEAMGEGTAFD